MLAPAKETRLAKRRASTDDGKPVPHWGVPEVIALVDAARTLGRGANGDRDALLISTIFDDALRVSEALGLRPRAITRTEGGYRLNVNGKTGGGKWPSPLPLSPSSCPTLTSANSPPMPGCSP